MIHYISKLLMNDPLCLKIFTEAFLAQLSSVAAQLVPQGSNRWGDAPRRNLIEAARDILVAMGSSPAHGMCNKELSRGSSNHREGSWGAFMAAVQPNQPAGSEPIAHAGESTMLLRGGSL